MAGAPEEYGPISVTPAMLEAGLEVFTAFDQRFDDPNNTVEQIYKHMEQARRNFTEQDKEQEP